MARAGRLVPSQRRGRRRAIRRGQKKPSRARAYERILPPPTARGCSLEGTAPPEQGGGQCAGCGSP
jgi:hypothetical protein